MSTQIQALRTITANGDTYELLFLFFGVLRSDVIECSVCLDLPIPLQWGLAVCCYLRRITGTSKVSKMLEFVCAPARSFNISYIWDAALTTWSGVHCVRLRAFAWLARVSYVALVVVRRFWSLQGWPSVAHLGHCCGGFICFRVSCLNCRFPPVSQVCDHHNFSCILGRRAPGRCPQLGANGMSCMAVSCRGKH